MIYELRTYQLAFGGLSDYLEVAKTMILPGVAEYGLKPVGFWSTEIGQLNEVCHLWAYEDLNDRQAKWSKWGRDPRRAEVAKKLRGVILSQTNKILSPTEFSPLQ